MNEIIQCLLFNLERSEKAYRAYLLEKKYYQALRIYKANNTIYSLLTKHAFLWQEYKEIMINYCFHLEDWLEQFEEEVRNNNPALDSQFVFTRFEGSPAYPSGICDLIKKVK